MPRTPNRPFWDHAAPLLASGKVEEGTIMGGPCLRARGEFVAMPYHLGEGLVLKLNRARVAEFIAAGDGLPFAPAGRVFREWVLVTRYQPALWDALLAEAHAFATGGS